MTLEGQVEQVEQNEQFPQHEPEQIKPSNENELLHFSIPVQIDAEQPEEFLQKNEKLALEIGTNLSEKAKRSGRIAIFLVLIGILFAGQFGVPDNEVKCVQDKVIEALGFANRFINTPGNERYRDFFQAFCSFLLDIIFLGTLGYWVLRGKSCRLPLSLGIFYGVRAIIQALWMSPFPEGNYWYSPGFPSLVVPYGRQSDFFFSGHSGFLVICACEWHKLKMPKLRNFVICTAIYTILILLIYRTHYIIDIFTGVIFAEWCFNKIDTYKDLVDKVWMQFLNFVKCLVGIRAVGINCAIYDEKGNPISPKI